MAQDSFFEEGRILYFTPFFFNDGGEPKPKYFLVLRRQENPENKDDMVLLASLPTSRDFVPSTIERLHGCIDRPGINFNCYYYEGGRSVCENGFAFPVDTFVYGYRLQQFSVTKFRQLETAGQTTIQEKGKLTETEYYAIVSCLKTSSSVKHIYRRLLANPKNTNSTIAKIEEIKDKAGDGIDT